MVDTKESISILATKNLSIWTALRRVFFFFVFLLKYPESDTNKGPHKSQAGSGGSAYALPCFAQIFCAVKHNLLNPDHFLTSATGHLWNSNWWKQTTVANEPTSSKYLKSWPIFQFYVIKQFNVLELKWSSYGVVTS